MNKGVVFLICAAFVVLSVTSEADARAQKEGCPPPNSSFGICVITKDNCFGDESCKNGKMCCPEGCGSVCKDPQA